MIKKHYDIINDIIINLNFINLDYTLFQPLNKGNIPNFTCYQNLKEKKIIIISRINDIESETLFDSVCYKTHDLDHKFNCGYIDFYYHCSFNDNSTNIKQYDLFCVCEYNKKINTLSDWNNIWELKLLQYLIYLFKEKKIDIVSILKIDEFITIQIASKYINNIPNNLLDNDNIFIVAHFPNKKYKIPNKIPNKIQQNIKTDVNKLYLIQITILSSYEQQILKKSCYNNTVIRKLCNI